MIRASLKEIEPFYSPKKQESKNLFEQNFQKVPQIIQKTPLLSKALSDYKGVFLKNPSPKEPQKKLQGCLSSRNVKQDEKVIFQKGQIEIAHSAYQDKCEKHPNRKVNGLEGSNSFVKLFIFQVGINQECFLFEQAKYFMNSNSSKRFCSKCALFFALKGERIEVALEQEEQFRKQETDSLIQDLKLTQDMISIGENEGIKSKERINQFYQLQLQTVENQFKEAQKILVEERNKIINQMEKSRSASLKQIEDWINSVQLFKQEVKVQETDIINYYDNIISEMENKPFLEIIKKYNKQISQIQANMKELSLQKITVLAARKQDLESLISTIERNVLCLANDDMNITEKYLERQNSLLSRQHIKIQNLFSPILVTSKSPENQKDKNELCSKESFILGVELKKNSQISQSNGSGSTCLDLSSFRRNQSNFINSENSKNLSLSGEGSLSKEPQPGSIIVLKNDQFQPKQSKYISSSSNDPFRSQILFNQQTQIGESQSSHLPQQLSSSSEGQQLFLSQNSSDSLQFSRRKSTYYEYQDQFPQVTQSSDEIKFSSLKQSARQSQQVNVPRNNLNSEYVIQKKREIAFNVGRANCEKNSQLSQDSQTQPKCVENMTSQNLQKKQLQKNIPSVNIDFRFMNYPYQK